MRIGSENINDIEQFCEKAFRVFHFRPSYILYKIGQAIRSPREGWRSLVAGLHFVIYTVTNRRKKEVPFEIERMQKPEGWTEKIRVPIGRMERIKKGLDPSLEAQLEDMDDGPPP